MSVSDSLKKAVVELLEEAKQRKEREDEEASKDSDGTPTERKD